ncbi:MAG: hypothetical protein R8M38_03975 [Mariprofundaceae bacterium]
MIRQQLLDLCITPQHSYGEWVRHNAAEAAHNRLALWLIHGGFLYLHSQEVAGKTHLLHAFAEEHAGIGLLSMAANSPSLAAASLVRHWLSFLSPHAFWMVDMSAGELPQAKAMALFHLIERARETHRPLLISWRCADKSHICPELTSRLRSIDSVELAPPTDDEALIAILDAVTKSRQWQVDPAVFQLMLQRLPRQLPKLLHILETLEKQSQSESRRLTTAWLRRYLAGMESE